MITAKQNADVVERLMRDWNLGPAVTSVEPKANKMFWDKIARAWGIPEAEARQRFCANCEYFDNTPEKLKEMEAIPLNAMDRDGGGRGWCHAFDFICHNLRVCQMWELKEYESEDDDEESEGKD